jgi:hypothetical protein
MKHQFTAKLHLFEDNLWFYHVLVPEAIAAEYLASETGRRVLCSIEGSDGFHAGLMPDGLGGWFININQKLRDALGLREDMEVTVTLAPDPTPFGMPMPEEFEECLWQNPEAKTIFEALTPGRQRNLIYIVNNVKSPAIKLRRSLVITNHLLQYPKIDFKALNVELKAANQKAKP